MHRHGHAVAAHEGVRRRARRRTREERSTKMTTATATSAAAATAAMTGQRYVAGARRSCTCGSVMPSSDRRSSDGLRKLYLMTPHSAPWRSPIARRRRRWPRAPSGKDNGRRRLNGQAWRTLCDSFLPTSPPGGSRWTRPPSACGRWAWRPSATSPASTSRPRAAQGRARGRVRARASRRRRWWRSCRPFSSTATCVLCSRMSAEQAAAVDAAGVAAEYDPALGRARRAARRPRAAAAARRGRRPGRRHQRRGGRRGGGRRVPRDGRRRGDRLRRRRRRRAPPRRAARAIMARRRRRRWSWPPAWKALCRRWSPASSTYRSSACRRPPATASAGAARPPCSACSRAARPGLVVVNIDNGVGAGATAALIARRCAAMSDLALILRDHREELWRRWLAAAAELVGDDYREIMREPPRRAPAAQDHRRPHRLQEAEEYQAAAVLRRHRGARRPTKHATASPWASRSPTSSIALQALRGAIVRRARSTPWCSASCPRSPRRSSSSRPPTPSSTTWWCDHAARLQCVAAAEARRPRAGCALRSGSRLAGMLSWR